VGIVIVPITGGADSVPLAIRPPLKPAKITAKKAKRIMALYNTGRYSRPRLAQKFGCRLSDICDVTEGRVIESTASIMPKAVKPRRPQQSQ
jgi:hypothetical protein